VVEGDPMSPWSKVEPDAAIRRDAHAGVLRRALQRRYQVGFPDGACGAGIGAAGAAYGRCHRGAGRLDEFKPVIDEWLRADLVASRKQRHTAKRIFDRLLDEEQAAASRLSRVDQGPGCVAADPGRAHGRGWGCGWSSGTAALSRDRGRAGPRCR
jgi:hypothetical protein